VETPVPQITKENVHLVFTYHAPSAEQTRRYELLRKAGLAFAEAIIEYCNDCPERTLALRDVQRAVMMANASIALEGIS
jgi:hypothetical protein